MKSLTLVRPDDWHLHLRDGAMMRAVLPHTARDFARAIIMPNLVPPVVTGAQAAAYRERIMAALPDGTTFEPLMTLYLTEDTDPEDVATAYSTGLVKAVKLYPAGATTNSASGVANFEKVRGTLERMAEIGLPLCVHGEVTDEDIDIFDREAVFIDRVLDPIATQFARPARSDGTYYHTGCRRLRACPRRHSGCNDHHAPPDHQPKPHPRRRDQTALLLLTRGQARNPPPRSARRRDQQ